MAKRGGARLGAGRPQGSPNKRNTEMLAKMLESGQSPIAFMLDIMRDESADPKRREWAAEKAAPYLHPRPQPIAQRIEIDLPEISTLEGVKAAAAKIFSEIASGNLAPAEGAHVMSIIEAQRKVIETTDLEARIQALEAGSAR